MIDLHCHSHISDGALPPEEVVALAAKNGCTMLALTDHDHTGGLVAARSAAQQHNIRFINGVEISVTWRGRTIHMVGLDFDEHESSLQSLLAQLRQGRIERMEKIGAKLAKRGIEGAAAGALSLAANPEMVSRTHMAQWLVQQGLVRNKQAAFTQFLGEGKCAAVRHQWAELADAVAAVRAAGGLAVIAHPMRYDMSATARRQLFEEFKQLGGHGIEVHSSNCSLGDRLNYALSAQRYGLLASLGSDFHQEGGYSGAMVGICPELPPTCEPVWKHFRNA